MDKLLQYWDYAAERAVKTLAQAALATIGIGAAGVLDVDWLNLISVAALAGIMSLLTSVLVYDKESAE
tara:strand:- start:485 stop:688 length:204 start_codon:yes stop_codon:yes gene_type:complete